MTDAGPRGTVDLRSLEGSLGGYPVQGTGRVALVEAGFAARDLSLRTGENLLTLSGDVAQTLSLDYRLNAPDLSQLWPGLAGAVRGDGQVRGTTEAPRVQTSLTARGLSAGDATLAGANLEADLDMSGRGQLSLRAEVDGIGLETKAGTHTPRNPDDAPLEAQADEPTRRCQSASGAESQA